ncbi:cytochrome c oxidase subunit 3 [Piscirickettsia litoralis]|uniref:Cytochrome o ubiquinol oxidase subunit III n=1 Tax=Piscirickettsia litoralis TaxID=1891921 RepID=A0ABX3A5Q8_9GAMM|nr:cytochrome c oxidase subunit 3 [Piscirickettsia litoralis]ODN43026.1 cytochrome o ubiquinol oxidase subunit III [Piscirickettsia litoralis]
MTATTMNHHKEHHHHDDGSKSLFGFWTFVLSDAVLFAALFACYVVLKDQTYGNIGIVQIASPGYVFLTTLFLLACSFTYGISSAAAQAGSRGRVLLWLIVTIISGIVFVSMTFHEFAVLFHNHHTWHQSAFLSAFFSLVGIHMIHVIVALLWAVVLIIQFLMQGITTGMRTRLACMGMFFHFLNLVWVFIFIIVYMMGIA